MAAGGRDGAACPESCARKLYITRNSHASQGKNVDRLAGLVHHRRRAGAGQGAGGLQGHYHVARRPRPARPLPAGRPAATGRAALAAPIWIIDPLGNLMMQYPADADGVKVRGRQQAGLQLAGRLTGFSTWIWIASRLATASWFLHLVPDAGPDHVRRLRAPDRFRTGLPGLARLLRQGHAVGRDGRHPRGHAGHALRAGHAVPPGSR